MRSALTVLSLLLVLSVISIAPASAQGGGDVRPREADEARIAAEIFDYVNDERAARGIDPLPWSDALAERAAAWSDEMQRTGNFSHSSSAFRTPDGWDGTGENIAARFGATVMTSGALHGQWMRSDGHRRNILEPGYDGIGIGIICANGEVYATQVLGIHPDAAGNTLEFEDDPQDPIVHADLNEGTDCGDDVTFPPTPSPHFENRTPVVITDPAGDPPPGDGPAPGGAAPGDPAPGGDPEAGEPETESADGDEQPVEVSGGADGAALADTQPAVRAAAVSRMRFPDQATRGADGPRHAVLARDDDVADALAASVLLGDGPLLLTPTDGLDLSAIDELGRLFGEGSGATVYLMGGQAAISAAVEDQLADLGYQPVRLSGASRVETAVAVAEHVGEMTGTVDAVSIARAYGPADNPTAAWADAISVGAMAAADGAPVLLTPSGDLHPAAEAYLRRVGPTSVVLGGEAAIAPSVLDRIPGVTSRLAGSGRAETAAVINGARTDRVLGGPVVAFDGYGEDGWVDGLLAAGLAADLGATTLLVGVDAIPAATAALLEDGCSASTVLGPLRAVGQDVRDQLAAICR